MEITRDDIVEAITKLRQAGKRMPQADRIKAAADKVREEQNVMAETVQIMWQLFIPKHVSREAWAKATEIAMLKNDINSQIITPGLMQTCLKELEQAYMLREAERCKKEKEAEKDFSLYDPDTRNDVLVAMAWGLRTLKERADISARGGNPIGDFVQPDNVIVKHAMEIFGLTEAEAWGQKVLLRCWHNDRLYSKKTGAKAKTSIAFSDEGRMVLCYD